MLLPPMKPFEFSPRPVIETKAPDVVYAVGDPGKFL
jgi:hypothetical protein